MTNSNKLAALFFALPVIVQLVHGPANAGYFFAVMAAIVVALVFGFMEDDEKAAYNTGFLFMAAVIASVIIGY